jgi:hypothetical protein
VTFVQSSERTNEITLVTLVNLFPLRFVKTVKVLREQYGKRIAALGVERATLEIHLEGDGSQLPDLYIADDAQVAKRARAALLLADALGLLNLAKSAQTGQSELQLMRKDSDGFDCEPVVLGKAFDEAADALGEKLLMELKAAIAQQVSLRIATRGDVQTEVRAALLANVSTMKEAAPAHLAALVNQRWSDAARDAMKYIRKEADL